MWRALYRKCIAVINSVKLFFWSFKFLGPKNWFAFWFNRKSECAISLGGIAFNIRCSSLASKIVDLYMAASCIISRQYSPKGFEIRDGDTVIDIGAHIGSFALLAARMAPYGKIFAFEPDPENYKQLLLNINANNAANVTTSALAVSETRGKLVFQKDALNSAESSLFKPGSYTVEVESTTLEDIFDKNKISACNILKLDCEGAEYEILYGAPEKIFSSIEKIVMECHSPEYFGLKDSSHTQKEMAEFLKTRGFAVRVVPENAMHCLIFAERKS
ncbi:MAG: FkbM family methyltransferase [Candidatus Ryanbacteria bacterium]|nr:FkbM family methyltransferase [Candidatus Ryanbacteria bacterium]